jgi:levanbiose-producing levanase
LWYSTDGGATFQFDAIVQKNPLAGNTTISDLVFRDPCVFWHAPSSRWIMSLAEIGKISIYSSVDLKNWVYQSAMVRSDLGTLECPHLFQLHVYNADASTAGDKWVLLCGANGTTQGFTTGTAYWVGGFDGTAFTPDSSTPQWLDMGPDFYATTVFADANASDPLTYTFAIAWENNWDYAKVLPTSGYMGQLSIVRQLRLEVVNGSTVLLNMPVAAQDNVFQATVGGTNQTISDSAPYKWPVWSNNYSSRIDFTISPVSGTWPSAINLSVRSGNGYATVLSFKPSANLVVLNRSNCGPAPVSDAVWNGQRQASVDFSNVVSVSLYLDANSIEVFLNGGTALSGLIMAPSDATGLSLSASGGSAVISNLTIKH